MNCGGSKSPKDRAPRLSISDSIKKAFGPQRDSQGEATQSSNARRGVRGLRISDPIQPEGGLPLPALVKPSLQPPQKTSNPSVSSRKGGTKHLQTLKPIAAQGSLPPTFLAPVRLQVSNPSGFPRRESRGGSPLGNPMSPQNGFAAPVPPPQVVHSLRKTKARSSLRLVAVGQETEPPGRQTSRPTTIPEIVREDEESPRNGKLPRRASVSSSSSSGSVYQSHPWQDILTDETLWALLQRQPARERFKGSISRLGKDGPKLLDIWLATKAQKAAQEYADTLLKEVQGAAARTLGSRADESLEMVGQLAFKKLLWSQLPRDIDAIIESWIDSAAMRDAMKFTASGNTILGFSGRGLGLSKDKLQDLFKSFSISDPRQASNAVRLTSLVLQEGNLTAFTSLDQSCTIHTVYSSRGEPSSYNLLLKTPLLSQETGQTCYLLISQTDITYFVQRHVVDTLLAAGGTGSTKTSGELDTTLTGAYKRDPGSHPKLEATVLLDNAFRWGVTNESKLLEKVPAEAETPKSSTFDWLGISYKDKRKKRNVSKGAGSSRTDLPHGEPQVVAFPDLVREIIFVYREYFLLSPSAEQDYYEISYISPALFAEGEYITGHLTHTAPEIVQDIGNGLAR